MQFSERISRHANQIKLWSVLLIVVSLLVIMRSLPVQEGVKALQSWIESLGLLGPVMFILVYLAATLLLVPGSILTIASGAIFGLLYGVVYVSVASTTSVALAFLIARYLAREKVAEMVKNNEKFEAVDRAIRDGDWKIVAMLRLSPALPFSLQNYMYGLTGVRFWTCVLTSWVTMLPGTFMYVYIGYAGRAAATGRSLGEWVLLGVGLAATIAVTWYITALAKKKLAEKTRIVEEESMQEDGSKQTDKTETTAGRPWGATVALALALLMVVAAGCSVAFKEKIRSGLTSLFGPPAVELKEVHAKKADGPDISHEAFNELLGQHVDDSGWVNYQNLEQDGGKLDQYLDAVAKAPVDDMGRNQKLALLINAYNAFTLKLILHHYEEVKDHEKGIRSLDEPWDSPAWNIGGNEWTLNEIEHEQIRPKFKEPRIHFALVCAAVGCPPLRNEAYVAEKLDQQLEEQTVYVHNHETWFRFEPDEESVWVTPLYSWYGGDFKQVAGSVLKYVAQYFKPLQQALDSGETFSIRWLDYDWKLNSAAHKQER